MEEKFNSHTKGDVQITNKTNSSNRLYKPQNAKRPS